jgi:hypothetical protein
MTFIRDAQPMAMAINLPSARIGGNQDAYLRILAWEEFISRRRQMSRLMRYRRNLEYYSGDNMPPGQYIQPLAINYLQAIVENHSSYVWGQWEESQTHIINWVVKAQSGKGDQVQISAIKDWCESLFDGYEEVLYDSTMNQSIFGDAILRPKWDTLREIVYPESILPEYFHCRWSPHDITQITETILAYPMSRQDAGAEFGTIGDVSYAQNLPGYSNEFGIYWEHWTPERCDIYLDSIQVRTAANPYMRGDLPGFIPFVHIPNWRNGGEFYGISDIEGVLELQDEYNRKAADAGDIISYAAHPIILIRKYFGRVTDLPVGPDAIWDMGRDGEAEYLSGDKPPVDISLYLDRVLETIQDLARMPAAAFGRSEKAKSSALAMAMEMMPVSLRVSLKRLHWKRGLVLYAHLAARLQEKAGELPFKRSYLNKVKLIPAFAAVLPRDRAALVNEQVSLVTNGIRSTRRALEILGEQFVEEELAEIMQEMAWKAELGVKLNLGGKNARGPGGSPETATDNKEMKKEGVDT